MGKENSELLEFCGEHWSLRGLTARKDWDDFYSRLEIHFDTFVGQLWKLYGQRKDFAFYVSSIIEGLYLEYETRPLYLRKRDRDYPAESRWYQNERLVGAVAYVDRFAGSFAGLHDRVSYLKELGVGYLHLMPFFKSPENHNDGGYAVSSYREVDPSLGTLEDLRNLAEELLEDGIVLVADFVFNHTSDEHEWARRAKDGDKSYERYYLTFDNYQEVEAYQRGLRDIFPEVRKGSFTFCKELGKWVWTTFHSYQWDLKYEHPAVFGAMVREMLAIANMGFSVLRLDAVAFTWKKMGTTCENLDEAHTLIRAFRTAAAIAAPSLVFKSEAIVHPDAIARYIDTEECQLSYNPLLMAELWEASATKEVRLLARSVQKRHRVPEGCSWVNYVRCHDDIGWTFADEDAAELWIKGNDHRRFLNRFYFGKFPGSFSRGVGFQYNPVTGDQRICGTAASLAGIEQAIEEGNEEALARGIRRLLMVYGIAYSIGGIPLLYLGDETAVMNDYSYAEDPHKREDSRWVHRPRWSDAAYAERHAPMSLTGQIGRASCRERV